MGVGEKATNICMKKCPLNKSNFYKVSFDDANAYIGPSVTSYKNLGSEGVTYIVSDSGQHSLAEVLDGYPLSVLLSDLGGLLGTTLGLSVASVLAALVPGLNGE